MTHTDSAASPVGLTRETGWEIGVRRTLPYSADTVWELLMSSAGRTHWLGPDAALPPVPKSAYRASNGTTGELRSYTTGQLIRLTWRPSDWGTPSTLQLRLIPAANGTTLSVHQERLDSAVRREDMRAHWSGVIDRLEAILAEEPPPI